MDNNEIIKRLNALQDTKYRDFQSKLIPDTKAEFIGVRTPELRKLAKELIKEGKTDNFLSVLPHKYFDENQLHAFIISGIKDFNMCVKEVERFLPYVDNWATCDQMSPKVFKKEKKALLPYINKWIKSGKTYTVRFGMGMLMQHFLGENFEIKYARAVACVKSDEYYIKMMQAWYFATALAKNYDEVLPFIENKTLEKWTHNKTIQKAIESYRITAEQKAYLKTLKIK